MPERQERTGTGARSDPSSHARGVATILSRVLESYFGARQLASDLDRYPHTLTVEQRALLENGIQTFWTSLSPVAKDIQRTLVSPAAIRRLADATQSDPERARRWEQFATRAETFRDALACAARVLRVKKSTGEFFETKAETAGGDVSSADSAVLEREKKDNRELLALEVLAAVTHPASRPIRILVDVTNKCNFRCRTCYQSKSQDFVSNDLDSGSLEGLRPFLRTALTANFSGTGEPLLSPLTPGFLRLAKGLGVETELVTNGSLLHRLAGLEDSISRLFLSLDGASAETVDTIRKGAKFENILAAVRALPPSFRARIHLNMVVCRANLHEVHAVARLARELGVAELHLQEFYPYLPWHGPMTILPGDQPMLRRELSLAHAELSGSRIPLRVLVKSDANGHAADQTASPAPDYRSILEELDRTPLPQAKGAQGWDVLAHLLNDAREIVAPEEISQSLASGGENSDEDAPSAHPPESIPSRKAHLLSMLKERPSLPLPHCIAPYALLYVLGDGATRPCCIIERRAGDLNSSSVNDNWHAPAYVALRRSLATRQDMPEACTGCRDGSRFVELGRVLEAAAEMGLALDKIQLPEDAEVPQPFVELLEDARARAASDPALIRGQLDHVLDGTVVGWAFHPERPSGTEDVDVSIDGAFVVRCTASAFRDDLLSAGVGDGKHGFFAELPKALRDGQTHEISARFARSGVDLAGSPVRVRLS